MSEMTPIPLFLFSIFYLAHTVGDFVLQTESIVKGKQSSLRVLTWHVLQHVLATLVLLTLAWPRLVVAAGDVRPGVGELGICVGVVAVVHLLVDKAKILAVARWGHNIFFYLTDQLVHVITLAAVIQWLMARTPEWSFASVGPILFLGQQHDAVAASRALLVLGSLVLALRGGAILAWLMTMPLQQASSDEAWAAAGLPTHPLKHNPSLVRGYAIRGILLLAAVAWPWWLAIGGLAVVTVVTLQASADADPLVRSYRRRELVAGLGSVIALAALVRGLT